MSRSSAAAHLLATAGLGVVVVTASPAGFFVALAIWIALVAGWAKRRALAGGWRVGGAELLAHLAIMGAIVSAAAAAPVKTADRLKARPIILPKQAMTVGELQSPPDHGLAWPARYRLGAPDDLAGRVVRFPARELTVGEFIAAIEAQTPLRHYYGSCGNGGGPSILWGRNCAFGLIFDIPRRKEAP